MALSDFFKRVLIVTVGIIVTVIVLTTIMTFIGVSAVSFNPYMYFIIAMGLLAVFLSPKPLSIVDLE
jgi:hypothetical protein